MKKKSQQGNMEKARQHGKSTATWKKHRNMTKATQHVTSTVTIYNKHRTKNTKNGPPRWRRMKRQQAWMHDGSNNEQAPCLMGGACHSKGMDAIHNMHHTSLQRQLSFD